MAYLSNVDWSGLVEKDKSDVEVVVARYDEQLEWLFPVSHLCTIYNKGKPLAATSAVPLANVGRESQTYLQHIIRTYHSLPEVTLFLQGAVNDRPEQPLLPIAKYAEQHALSATGNVKVSIRGQRFFNYREKYDLPDHLSGRSKYDNLAAFMDSVLGLRAPLLRHRWIPGANFSVSKANILSNPREYYQSILARTTLNSEVDPEDGHYMERSWYYVFAQTNPWKPMRLRQRTPHNLD